MVEAADQEDRVDVGGDDLFLRGAAGDLAREPAAAGQQGLDRPFVVGTGPEAATGMLAIAQKLHDEHVRSGEEQRDRLVADAKTHAERLVREAEERKAQTLGSLEQERSLLERKIDELRSFERDYRTRLKSYLETQLRDLDATATVVPGRGSNDSGGFGKTGS